MIDLACIAVLGGLAIAFQGLLRDGVAGLVALLDDHYAVGDVVEVNGVVGEVVDVGLLMTELRTGDQRAVQFANSSPQQLINHTKIRSGAEVLIPLAAASPAGAGAGSAHGAMRQLGQGSPLEGQVAGAAMGARRETGHAASD